MTLHKRTDDRGEYHHDDRGEDDRGDHDRELVDHTDGSDNGVEREYNVEQKNLYDYPGEGGRDWSRAAVRFSRFEFMVDFKGAFTQKKQPTREQKEIATADPMTQQRE